MVSAAQRQALLVREGCQIVRMRRFHHETNQRATLPGWSENAHARHFREALDRVCGKLRIMRENFGAPDSFDVINRGRESDRAGNIGSARLESMRRLLERAFFQRHAHDHLAAAVPGREGIENLRAAIKRADAGGRAHFVAGENQKIAA